MSISTYTYKEQIKRLALSVLLCVLFYSHSCSMAVHVSYQCWAVKKREILWGTGWDGLVVSADHTHTPPYDSNHGSHICRINLGACALVSAAGTRLMVAYRYRSADSMSSP